MAYLSQTPPVDPNAMLAEMEEKARQAMWAMGIILAIVFVIMFAGKRR